MDQKMTQPLSGLKVLDFSTLLPGPLCSLLLAEAGAEVIKLERPERGDEMRSYEPRAGVDSANFVLLNRGKKSVGIDLKSPDALALLTPVLKEADVLMEQFRPGVMDRLGLGYEALSRINPRLIYCSITGFGQHGPRAKEAAHDLNYVAASGTLSLTAGCDGAPVLPPALIADIAGGAYPAMINILLALRQRDQTGKGMYLDVAMADNLFTLQYWGLGNGALRARQTTSSRAEHRATRSTALPTTLIWLPRRWKTSSGATSRPLSDSTRKRLPDSRQQAPSQRSRMPSPNILLPIGRMFSEIRMCAQAAC